MKYFYKTESNIDFVWKISKNQNDPYKESELLIEHFVNNVKQHVIYILESEDDLKKWNLLTNYTEATIGTFDSNNTSIDEQLGLLHKDPKFQTIYAYRHINHFNKIVPIEFSDSLGPINVRALFTDILTLTKESYQKIIDSCYTYFKSLWEVHEYYSETKLDTIDKFLPTIELNNITINDNLENKEVTFYFRPSWDTEHGLYILFNFNTMECQVEEL